MTFEFFKNLYIHVLLTLSLQWSDLREGILHQAFTKRWLKNDDFHLVLGEMIQSSPILVCFRFFLKSRSAWSIFMIL